MRHYDEMCFLVVAALLLCSLTFSSACPEFCTCDSGEVHCRNAELTSIPEGLGEDIIGLDLSNNNISIIGSKAFESMPSLKKIIIRDCGINVIQPEAFSGIESLETLDLHGNFLEYLHPSIFQDNLNLLTLDLSGNSLQTFEPILNSELKFLNLSENQITSESFPDLIPLTSLETLDLSSNDISNLTNDIFSAMDKLSHLDISGNPRLEYDCGLKTVWTLCRNKNINCVIDDEESWKMVENLNCGEDDGVTEEEPTTPEGEGFLSVENSVVENEAGNSGNEEGSGAGETDTAVDSTPNPNVEDHTGEATEEPAIIEEENWIMIVIIVAVVIGILLFIAFVVVCFIRRKKSRVHTTGNISRADSITYLNQQNEFGSTYNNSRNNSVKKTDNSKVRTNNYDRVMNVPNYAKPDPTKEVIQLSEYATAEVTRVPSFKTQGISTPLNLPEEITPNNSQSLPRRNQVSSYEDNNTIRAGSLRKPAKTQQLTVPDIQKISPMQRIPSNKRRHN